MSKRLVIAAVLAAAFLAACGGSGGGTASGDAVTVKMFDNRYEYTEIHVAAGGTVTFEGAGRNPHNAVDATGTWSTEDEFGSLDMLEGDEATISFDEPGEYTFFCTYHGNADGEGMAGTIVVEEAAS
jgi:plastocyanin